MVIVINNINNLGEHRDRFRDQPLGKNVMKLLQRLISKTYLRVLCPKILII